MDLLTVEYSLVIVWIYFKGVDLIYHFILAMVNAMKIYIYSYL